MKRCAKLAALVLAFVFVSACGAAGSPTVASSVSGWDASPGIGLGIVAANDPGAFIVVDQVETAQQTSTRVRQVSADGAVLLSTLGHGLLAPVGWRDPANGNVTVLGMQCDSAQDEDDAPTCPQAPIVIVRIAGDAVTVTDSGVTTSSEIGFSAAPDGGRLIISAFTGWDADASEGRFGTFAVDADETVHDLGATGPVRVCPAEGGPLVIPRAVDDFAADQPISRVVGDQLVTVAPGPGSEGDASPIYQVTCAEAGQIVNAFAEGGATTQAMLDVDGTSTSTVPEAPAGALAQESNGRWFAWVAGSGDHAWNLQVREGSSWTDVASVTSLEAPRLTTFNGDSGASVIVAADGTTRVTLITGTPA